MPEGIAELGESLLARAKETNKRRAKESRREAYKIAFATGAVGLTNNILNRRAEQFLQNEQVLAVKGRYKANADQAAQILGIQEKADAEGVTIEDYFYKNRYLPAMEAEYQAKYGDEGFTTSSYMPQLMGEARRLARAEATEFQEALSIANSLPSYEEAATNLNSLVAPPRNAGQALVTGVTDFFRGRDSSVVRQDILDRIDREGKIQSDSAKVAFSKVLQDSGASAAAEFADHFEGGKHAEDTVSEMIQFNLVGDDLVTTTIKTATDWKGNSIVTLGDTKTVHTAIDPTDAQSVAELANTIRNQVNIQQLAVNTLTRDAYANWQSALSSEGINAANLRDGDNWHRAGELYSNLTSDPQNVKDEVSANNVAANQQALFEVFANTISALEKDPTKLKEFMAQLQEWSYEWNQVQVPTNPGSSSYGDL